MNTNVNNTIAVAQEMAKQFERAVTLLETNKINHKLTIRKFVKTAALPQNKNQFNLIISCIKKVDENVAIIDRALDGIQKEAFEITDPRVTKALTDLSEHLLAFEEKSEKLIEELNS